MLFVHQYQLYSYPSPTHSLIKKYKYFEEYKMKVFSKSRVEKFYFIYNKLFQINFQFAVVKILFLSI